MDTNVFVEAHRRYYGFDLCPGFWKCLPHHFNNGRVFSIDKVRDEIDPGDALHNWVQTQCPSQLFAATDEGPVLAAYAQIMAWANANPQFTQAAKANFAGSADAWLVAYALAKGVTVVTREEHAAGARARILIPNVCIQFNVPYTDPFVMLRDLAAAFDWEAP